MTQTNWSEQAHFHFVIERKYLKEFEDIAVVYMEVERFPKALALLEQLVVDPVCRHVAPVSPIAH